MLLRLLILPGLLTAVLLSVPGLDALPATPPTSAMVQSGAVPADAAPISAAARPAPDTTDADTRARFRDAMEFAREQNLAALPLGEIMVRLGERYIGQPYLAGPLDGFGREVIVARLDAFDCFTYVEALLAMARGVARGDTTFAGYMQRTEEQRYRRGTAEGYCSRLHYFTDWVDANARRGLVTDITEDIGGKPFPKRYGFMTSHRTSYPALADDSEFQCIARVESDLNDRIRLFFVPQDQIDDVAADLRDGDLVAMVTNIQGLDVTHTGLVYLSEDGTPGLLHASTSGSVKISPDLRAYVRGVRSQIGILVARAD